MQPLSGLSSNASPCLTLHGNPRGYVGDWAFSYTISRHMPKYLFEILRNTSKTIIHLYLLIGL